MHRHTVILLTGLGLLSAAALDACKIRRDPEVAGGDLACDESSTCEAPPTLCLSKMCLDGECVFVPSPSAKLPLEAQVVGDCKQRRCDGDGAQYEVASIRDLPPGDGNPCTEAACEGTEPQQNHLPAGTLCGDNGVCNGADTCGVCIPDKTRCEQHAVATCKADGQWDTAKACSAAKPICNEARCVGVVELALGAAHACVRLDDGSVRCWGANHRSQLGKTATSQKPPNAGLAQIAVGRWHACGIRSGVAWCFGANDFGQLGRGDFASSNTSAAATGSSDVVQVAVGDSHSCARTTKGEVFCWGRNDRGQAGSGKAPKKALEASRAISRSSPSAKPTTIASIKGAEQLSLAQDHTCIRKRAALSCWGLSAFPLPAKIEAPPEADPDDPDATKPDPDEVERYENRESGTVRVPTKIAGLSSVEDIACGAHHCCALEAGETVKCWGANDQGQLGDRSRKARFKPVAVAGLKKAAELRLGWEFSCARTSESRVYCWGANGSGQLGSGVTPKSSTKPVHVVKLPPVSSLHTGDRFACATAEDGRVLCWGDSSLAQLGRTNPQTAAEPVAIQW